MAEERRLVTILFADVVGSTSLGESLDPEDVRALLGRLFAIARDAVEQHGGRVEKFIGDAIMAVFGLPVAHDDDPERALAAAIELRDRVREDAELRDRLAIRLGVNGGEVIASRDESAQEFLVTGDPVNVAARLQQGADPWAILVGERTVRAVGDRFTFGPPVAVDAKGKANAIPARDLLGAAGPAARSRRNRIVGRQSDLMQLDLTAQRSFSERRPFLVSVVAPAGVGKSRLLEEFLDHLDPAVQVALAQCLPYGQRLTYWPMRGILLSIVGLPDDSSPEEVRRHLVSWLADAGDTEPERTAELLAATIGASDVESGDRIALFAAWRRLVELAAERAPVVLVIEDLHWSSDSLLDLVEAILQPRVDIPLLMIVLARPELLDRRPGWGGGRRNAVSISLEALPEAAVAELVADLLGSPAPEIVAAVVARAEGNPFYAGEIVRSLTDQLGPDPDPHGVATAIAALPDTVHATVLARLDSLDPTARRVVQLGAVLGRSFPPRAVPALDPELADDDVSVAIDALIERDLLRSPARGQVTFRHILIREVAYSTLPRSERARLHAAAGTWLETEATTSGRQDELAELVAFHLREATTLGRMFGGTPAPELVDRAVRWLRQAGDAAAAGAAAPEAARHLVAAIELAPATAQPDLYERLGEVWVGGEQALEAFERATELGRASGLGAEQELRTLAQGINVLARWTGSVGAGRPPEEIQRRMARLEELVRDPQMSDRARLLGHLALSFEPTTNLTREPTPDQLLSAGRDGERALELARRLDDADLISAALDALSSAAMGDNQAEAVLELTAQRLQIADRLATSERVDAWIVTAWMNTILGRFEVADRAVTQARLGLGGGQGAAFTLGATAWRVLILQALGRWDEALTEAVRAERLWHESELRTPWFSLHGFLVAASIGRSRGDPVTADRWRTAATTIFQQSDPAIRTQRLASYLSEDLAALERDVVAEFMVFSGRFDYVYLALALLADRRHPAVVENLDRIIGYTEERHLLLVSSQARRLRGLVQRAPADLEHARASFAAMGARPGEARATSELGLVLRDRALVDEGLESLEALGDVEQARRVTAEWEAEG